MFENLTDEQFYIWLAGFFDGEGCIYIPKQPGIEICLASTYQPVITAIRGRLNMGVINEIHHSQAGWKNKYQWRLRNYIQVSQVLKAMRPYLTIKAEKADEALSLIDVKIKHWESITERNNQIIQLAQSGLRHVEIAEEIGLCRASIDGILLNARLGRGGRVRPLKEGTDRQFISRFIKYPVYPVTTCKRI